MCPDNELVQNPSAGSEYRRCRHQCQPSGGVALALLTSVLILLSSANATSVVGSDGIAKRGPEALLQDEDIGSDLEPHRDPNDEHHDNMIYVGRHACGAHHSVKESAVRQAEGDGVNDSTDAKRRLSADVDNGIKYIFGTSFDETHRDIEEEDLHHERSGADITGDIADRAHGTKTREEVLKERRHGKVDADGGPKPFGYVDTHPLDGGVVPPKVVHVDPFFMDDAPVTNKEFAKFVRATYYETEAEQFGWSFVLKSFLPKAEMLETADRKSVV